MHEKSSIIETKKGKIKRNIEFSLIILVSLIPSIIFSVYLFNQIKTPDESDFEYAKVIWNEGIENIAYKDLSIDISDASVEKKIYNGFSNFADTDSSLDITLENGDSLRFKGYNVEVLSKFILGSNTVFYKMDFSKENVVISKTIMPLIFDVVIWLIVCVIGFSFITLIIICVIVVIFEVLKENRRRY